MRKKTNLHSFLKNVGSGWVALLVGSVVGFVTLPLSMRYLGKELYGIAALTTSFLAVFQFLSFGMPSSILRFFSMALAKDDKIEIRKILSTSIFVLGALSFTGVSVFFCCYPFFVSTYSINQDARVGLPLLYFATGLHFLQTLVLIPLYAFVQAKNRYDLANYRRVISHILRISSLWIGYKLFPPTLYVLAISLLIACVYELLSLLWLAYKLGGNLLLPNLRYFSRATLKNIFSVGALSFVSQFTFSLSIQIPLLIIGKTLGKEAVANFVPSVTVGGFCASILSSISQPLAPLAAKDKIKGEGKKIGFYAVWIAETMGFVGCLICAGFAVLGQDFLFLWLGRDFMETQTVLTVMVVGVVYAAIQRVNASLALGSSTIAPFAYSSLTMAILVILGTFVGTKFCGWSLLGVAICIVVVRFFRNTVYLAWTYSRLFRYNYWEYLWRVYAKPSILACVVCALGRCVRRAAPEYEPTLLILILGALGVAFVYGLLGWYFVLSSDIKQRAPFLDRLPFWARNLLGLEKGK